MGIFFESSLPGYQCLIVFAGQDYWTYFSTVSTGGTFGFIDIPGCLVEGDPKITLRSLNLFYFRTSNEVDIQMPADLDQFRGDNSHGTVIGGEGLVQLTHNPADRGGLFNKVDQVPGIGKIKGCLHSSNPSADHHDRSHGFVRHDTLLYG